MNAARPTVTVFDELAGVLSDDSAVNQRLALAREKAILLSPATVCKLQPGCAVAFTLVWVPPSETYPVGGGKVALGRVALMRIASAAAVAWDTDRSGRVDNGRNPRCVHWRAVGAWQSLDGATIPLVGDGQLDLTNDSDATLKVLQTAKNPADGPTNLRDMRAKILERAQTGAKLRAIRDGMGIGSYTADEVKTRPFVVVRAFFDGHDEDPVMERENKRAIRAKMLGGARALFGPSPEVPLALGMGNAPRVLPMNVPDAEYEDDFLTPPPRTAAPAPAPAPPAARAPASPPPTTQSRAPATPPAAPPPAAAPPPQAYGGFSSQGGRPTPPQRQRSGLVIPAGRSKGTPIEDAEDGDLNYWAERIGGELEKGASRYPDKDRVLCDAMNAERDWRLGGSSSGAAEDADRSDDIPF